MFEVLVRCSYEVSYSRTKSGVLVRSLALSYDVSRSRTRFRLVTILRLAQAVFTPVLGQAVSHCYSSGMPSLLIAYPFVKMFKKHRKKVNYRYRDWMLDSGAFSAYNSGKVIDLHEYIDACHQLKEEDEKLKDIIALDVIGSDVGSLKNSITMKNAGVDAMPVFHIGDDWGIFQEYLDGWSKVGISCRFGEPRYESYKFYDQCFNMGWPKKLHSFGWMGEKMLMRYPLYSADSSSWELGPLRYDRHQVLGLLGPPVCKLPHDKVDIRSDVDWYLRLQNRVQQKWTPLFKKVGWCDAQGVMT
jgi:hypothetical protein